MRDLNERRNLAAQGVVMLDTAVYARPEWGDDYRVAMDAQPQLVTQVNHAIPAFLANIVDPEVLNVVMAPVRAAEIAGGEIQRGSWVDQSLMMPMAESVGHVVTYGDYDNGGQVDFNVDWTPRQPYHFQTIKRLGERQLAQWGLASVDANAQLDRSTAETFNRFRNKSYFYGIAGLQNYGLLNDPSLATPATPITKAAGGTSWDVATANEIYEDVLKLFTTLQVQMGGNLEMSDTLVLALSTTRQQALAKVSAFNVSARQMITENFPNLEIRAAPEYTTGSGELMQMFLPTYDGAQTVWASFTEKMRAHPVVQELSAWAQKFSGGTWGAIIRRPIAVAQMLGI